MQNTSNLVQNVHNIDFKAFYNEMKNLILILINLTDY